MNTTEERKEQVENKEVINSITFVGTEGGGDLECDASPDVTLYVATCLVENIMDMTGMDPDLILNQIMRDLKHRKMSQAVQNVENDLKDLFSPLKNQCEGCKDEETN